MAPTQETGASEISSDPEQIKQISGLVHRLRTAWLELKKVAIKNAPFGAICLVVIAIYFQMLLYPGYISWGNFGTPVVLTFDHSFFPNAITWSLFSSYGIPVVTPTITILDDVYYPILLFLGGGWNSDFAMKLFIVLSAIFFGSSFYKLTASFTQSKTSRSVATLFILLNPVAINFVQQGLFQSLFWQGFFFLGLAFLPKAIRARGIGRIKYCFLSAVCVSISAGSPELFYLGAPLCLIFIFYFAVVDGAHYDFAGLVDFLKTSLTTFTLIALLLMPLILTSIYGAYNIGPSSSYANPLSDYILYSANVWDILAMNANPAFPMQQLISNPVLSIIWVLSVDVVSLFILAGGLLVREGKLLFFSTVAVLAALLGAGAASPFSSFNIFLYENLPGYQLLNDGYFWAWIVIVPIYGIILSVLMERIGQILKSHATVQAPASSGLLGPFSHLRRGSRYVKPGAIAFCFILLLALMVPLATQPYYSANGIHPNDLPSNFSTLESQLSSLVGTSNSGVAYFPPDPGLLFGNSSGGSVNPLLLDPYVRSAAPVTYGSVSTPSGYYFDWVYDEFYSNQTRDVAQLMGVMGVKYFVTLNGVNGKGNVYTQSMSSQNNVSLIYTCPEYSIFENTLPVNVAMNVGNLTILSSSYTSLLAAAADGLDISQLPLAFISDIDSQNFDFFLNHTSALVLQGLGGLTPLAIASFINGSDSVNLADQVSNYAYSVSDGWVRSTALYVWPQTLPAASITAAPFPFAVTDSGATISAVLSLPSPGNYTLWTDFFNSPDSGSTLTLTAGNASEIVPTSVNAASGGFTWVGLPFYSVSSRVLIDATADGLNGLDRFVILKTGLVNAELKFLSSYVTDHRLSFITYGNESQSGNLSEALATINNSTKSALPLDLSSGPNSYEISGKVGPIALVRLNYFATMAPSDGQITELPVLGGMSYLIVSGQPLNQVAFVSVEYVPLLLGTVVSLSTITAILWLTWLIRPGRKIGSKISQPRVQ